MKIKLLVLSTIFILSVLSIFSQEIKNFKIIEGDLVWQKVYDIDIPQEKLTNFLTLGGYFEKIESIEGVISGNIRTFEVEVNGTGYSKGSLPMYVTYNDIFCFASIEFKPGRYRVTVSHINLIKKWDDPLGKKGEIDDLETFAVSKTGEFTANFVKKPSIVYDFNFNKIFEYKETKNVGNW
jgi:hypothetical protein